MQEKSECAPAISNIDPKAVTQYLTSIISSPLSWLKSDEIREQVWEEASARLSERSGRTGMKAIDRTFEIPTNDGFIDIMLHEPTLTSDNLGLKTWAASYLLAKRLSKLNLPESITHSTALELGSGTGLVGMAAAAVLGMYVYLTDLPEIRPNLARNVENNIDIICQNGGKATTGILDWTAPDNLLLAQADGSFSTKNIIGRVPFIIAADTIYSMEHPVMLVNVIKLSLAKSSDARVVFELPRRQGFEKELELLIKEMGDAGLVMLEQDEEVGYDDWGSVDDEKGEIRCWFSVWAWNDDRIDQIDNIDVEYRV